jgi:hypothetical protein
MTSTFLDTFLTKDNATPDYERFYYTKRYIASKSANFTSREAREELGRALGYKVEKPTFVAKLADRRRRYDAMDRRVPIVYLEAIGVKWDEFETCLEADMELFQSESQKPRYPRYAAIRYHPTFYGRVTFPEGTPESEALAMLNEGDTARFPRFVPYPELVMVFLKGGIGAEPVYGWYPPEVTFGRKDVFVQALPRGMGRVRIG